MPTATVPSASGAHDEVMSAMRAWLAAWAAKDLPAYLGSYVPDFVAASGARRAEWEAARARVLGRAGTIRVLTSNEELRVVDGSNATLRFLQRHSSDTRRDEVEKTLAWKKIDGRWLIASETTRPVTLESLGIEGRASAEPLPRATQAGPRETEVAPRVVAGVAPDAAAVSLKLTREALPRESVAVPSPLHETSKSSAPASSSLSLIPTRRLSFTPATEVAPAQRVEPAASPQPDSPPQPRSGPEAALQPATATASAAPVASAAAEVATASAEPARPAALAASTALPAPASPVASAEESLASDVPAAPVARPLSRRVRGPAERAAPARAQPATDAVSRELIR